MSNGYEFMKTGNREYIKSHSVYDGSNRLITVYEARANALHDHYALKTDYTYVGITSQIENSKESASLWDSSWDIP